MAPRRRRPELQTHRIVMEVTDPLGTEMTKTEGESPSLFKSIMNVLNGGSETSVERLAFEFDPATNNQFSTLYKSKLRLIPDAILKRIAIQDDLVAAICTARSQQMSVFGRPREDRHSPGFYIEPKKGITEGLDEQKKKELQDRIAKATRDFATCGPTEGWKENRKMSLVQWLVQSVKNAVTVGRIATEVVMGQDLRTNEKKFAGFRPIDAGTIYRATPQKEAAQQVREQAKKLLEQLANKKFNPEKYENDEYAWVQVIDGRPVQAFTAEECLVHNFYPVADIELDGYPVTPLDTVIAAVCTHINITTHNKLYFQSGRATRGMLVIQSDDADESVVSRIRQQFNASINNVNNSWRMPVFGVGKDETVTWAPIDSGGRDMEFQYLSDMNARVILSAFQMSPEELPGYSYLSRGTNNQALSESNNEYILEAHRDLGIRPLIKQFEDFLNQKIFPLIDPVLAKICVIRLGGLDADSPEKETTRIIQDSQVHMTFDEVMEKVEKDPIGADLGGSIPLNPAIQAIWDKYVPVGVILEKFLGIKGAAQNPAFAYIRDPFWFQFQQMQMQQAMMQQQAQAQQAQAQQAQAQQAQAAQGGGQAPPAQGGGQGSQGDEQGGGQPGPQQSQPTEKQKTKAVEESSKKAEGDLTTGVDQALGLLNKGENQLPPSRRRLLNQHKATLKRFMDGWDKDLAQMQQDVLKVVKQSVEV